MPSRARPRILPASPSEYTLKRRWLGHRLYWLCQVSGWGGTCAMMFFSSLAEGSGETVLLQGSSALALAGILSTHLLRLAVIWARGRGMSMLRFCLLMLPWLAAASAALHGIILGLLLVFSPEEFNKAENQGGVASYLSSVFFVSLVMLLWLCLYLGYHYFRSYQEATVERMRLKAAVKESELRTLKAQINPHFLFNSLNTLRSLIPEKESRPREAVTLLADLLRAALTMDEKQTVPLSQELETVQNYLALEKLRFEERLRVVFDIDGEALSWPVPPFLLQTLAENAVKYGVNRAQSGAELSLQALLSGDALILRVSNTGKLASSSVSTGMGLRNARARLRHLCGPGSTLDLRQEKENLVVAEAVVRLGKPGSLPPF